MRRFFVLFFLTAVSALPQTPANTGAAWIRDRYTKFEYRIPMRDGVSLFTAVYVPKDVFTEGKSYPVLMSRTPYSVRPYGVDAYPVNLGPSEIFAREKFIFAYQDVRGRYMSEGEFAVLRPYKPIKKTARDIDESSDAYDTVEWLLKNVPGSLPKVGVWGISAPGFYSTASLLDPHPAVAAVSPQAPVTDYYLGDDVYHNGAFMLAHRFRMYTGFKPRGEDPSPPQPAAAFNYGTPDGYEFFLSLGPLANAEEKYFKRQNPYWTLNVENTVYSDVWKERSIWKHLKGIKPAVMTVGGWFDTEDLQGPLRMFDFMEKNTPPSTHMLVMGPWTHGGFSRGPGDRVGNVTFGSSTGAFYRENIEFPFFVYYLKGRGRADFPKAWIFETGRNEWRKYDSWPPKTAKPKAIYLAPGGNLTWTQPAASGFDEYLSDPNKPVPYVGSIALAVRPDYMTEDQRFAAVRPDVLVYRTPPLEHDVTVRGPVGADLKILHYGHRFRFCRETD